MSYDAINIIKEHFNVSDFIILILIWAGFIIFRPDLFWAIVFLLLFNIGRFIYIYGFKDKAPTTIKNEDRRVISLIGSSFSIIIVLHIVTWLDYLLGNKGFYGLIIIALLLGIYRITRSWEQYLKALDICQRALTGGFTFKEQREEREMIKHERKINQ